MEKRITSPIPKGTRKEEKSVLSCIEIKNPWWREEVGTLGIQTRREQTSRNNGLLSGFWGEICKHDLRKDRQGKSETRARAEKLLKKKKEEGGGQPSDLEI